MRGEPDLRDPFEVLADAHRRAILATLAQGSRSVGELARGLPISRPAVSRHLRLLGDAGFVRAEASGNRRLYHLADDGLGRVLAFLDEVWGGTSGSRRR